MDKKQNNKKAISLIVLVITIVIMIILAGAVIITITNEEIIPKASEMTLKNKMSNYITEYNEWLAQKKIQSRNNLDVAKINVSSKVSYDGMYIQDIIKQMDDEDVKDFEIISGRLSYIGKSIGDPEELEKAKKLADRYKICTIYKALGDEDTIVFTDTTDSSGYDDIKIIPLASSGVEGLSNINLTVTQNLLDNGFGEYKNNTGFLSNVINVPDQKIKGSISIFKSTLKAASITTTCSNQKIEVKSEKEYIMSMWIKPYVTTSTIYSGHVNYDVDYNAIIPRNYTYINNTLTYLTQDLKKGDTVVHLNDISNFQNTESTAKYRLGFVFWNYIDSIGTKYPNLTYSRNVWSDLYTYDAINKENNTITLKSAWNKVNIPKGTYLSQSNDGATYAYLLYASKPTSTEWQKKTGKISGVNANGSASYNKFRAGTKYIDWFIMPNYNSIDGGGADIANIIIAESDKFEKEYTIDLTGHDPLRAMEDGTYDYIDYKTRKIIRKIGVNNGTLYKLPNQTTEEIELPDLPIYKGNTAITISQEAKLSGTYIK